jgi:hypothetical protein
LLHFESFDQTERTILNIKLDFLKTLAFLFFKAWRFFFTQFDLNDN